MDAVVGSSGRNPLVNGARALVLGVLAGPAAGARYCQPDGNSTQAEVLRDDYAGTTLNDQTGEVYDCLEDLVDNVWDFGNLACFSDSDCREEECYDTSDLRTKTVDKAAEIFGGFAEASGFMPTCTPAVDAKVLACGNSAVANLDDEFMLVPGECITGSYSLSKSCIVDGGASKFSSEFARYLACVQLAYDGANFTSVVPAVSSTSAEAATDEAGTTIPQASLLRTSMATSTDAASEAPVIKPTPAKDDLEGDAGDIPEPDSASTSIATPDKAIDYRTVATVSGLATFGLWGIPTSG